MTCGLTQGRSLNIFLSFVAMLTLMMSLQQAAQGSVPQLIGESGFAAYATDGEARVSASANASQALFLPQMLYDSRGYSPESLAVTDLNGDGKVDVVLANMCTNGGNCGAGTLPGEIAIMLGNGDGTFRQSGAYSSGGNRATGVAVADLNGDGKPDLVVANDLTPPVPCYSPCSNVTVLFGSGDGTFRLAATYRTGTQTPYNLVIADVNGDGKPDAIIGGANSSVVAVLLGNGNGTFLPAVTYDSGGAPETVAVADVNGDGKPDIVVADASSVVGVLPGNGNGTFGPVVTYPSGGTQSFFVAVADLNGDKKPDIVVTNYMNGNVGVLLGNGDGTFQPVETYDSGGGPQSWGIAVADMNGDDVPDLLVASFGCCISVLSGNGDGTFQPAVLLTDGVWFPNIVAVADVNVDGMPDLLAISWYGGPKGHGVLSVMINAGASRSATETVLSSSINPSGLNDAITYTATVTNASGGTANGKVAFQDNKFVIASAPVVSGEAVYSTAYKSTGTHNIRATYLGNSGFAGSYADVTERVQPPPFATSTVLATSGSPSFVGQPVTFTAAVSCGTRTIPDGELVTFYEGLTPLASVALGAGKATYTTSALQAATHYIRASYPGDATFKASSAGVNQVATRYATTTTVTSIPNPSNYGQSVGLKAQVRITGASAPTGWVSFKNGTMALGAAPVNATGVATLSKANLPLGSTSITATYNEGLLDTLNAKSTSPAIVQTVNQAQITMTLKSWGNPSKQGQSVLFAATLTSNGGLPNGQTVAFSYNGHPLGTATIVGGKANLTITTLPIGTDVVTATYTGDVNHSSATASVTQTVN